MYKYYNANPKNLEVEDCSIRCISALEGIPWNEAYKKLSNFGRKHGLMLSSVESIEAYLDSFYDRVPIYEETVGEFIENHPRGRFAITMPRTYYNSN